MGNPSQSYGASLAIWDGITQCYLLPETSERARHKLPQPTRLVLLPSPEGWKAELADNNSGRPGLRSARRDDLFVPRTKTTRLCRRSFFIAAPVVWNSLPLHLRSPSISRS